MNWVTLATLQISGKVPVKKEIFTILDKMSEKISTFDFRTWTGILFGPKAFSLFSDDL